MEPYLKTFHHARTDFEPTKRTRIAPKSQKPLKST